MSSNTRKQFLKSHFVHHTLAFLVSLLMRLIYLTCRVEKIAPLETLPYLSGEKPGVFCFWHGRMIMYPFLKPPGRTMSVLISHHNDGALIRMTLRWFDIGSVRGSSSNRRGSKALKDLLQVTQAGGNISMTPDGPRGPFQKAKPGAAFIAAKTGHPLLPVTYSTTRPKRLRSWDKFMIPMPFSRIVFMMAPPIFVADNDEAALDAATIALETQLTALTRENDIACGVIP